MKFKFTGTLLVALVGQWVSYQILSTVTYFIYYFFFTNKGDYATTYSKDIFYGLILILNNYVFVFIIGAFLAVKVYKGDTEIEIVGAVSCLMYMVSHHIYYAIPIKELNDLTDYGLAIFVGYYAAKFIKNRYILKESWFES